MMAEIKACIDFCASKGVTLHVEIWSGGVALYMWQGERRLHQQIAWEDIRLCKVPLDVRVNRMLNGLLTYNPDRLRYGPPSYTIPG